MLVCPMTWTWAISLQFVPITTLRPIMQKGPIVVPSPITAPSSTRAVGSIVVIEEPLSLAGIWRELPGFSVVSASRGGCPVTCHLWSRQGDSRLVHRALDKGGALRNHAHIGKGLCVTFGFDVNVDDDRLRLAFPGGQNLRRHRACPGSLDDESHDFWQRLGRGDNACFARNGSAIEDNKQRCRSRQYRQVSHPTLPASDRETRTQKIQPVD